MTKFDSWRQEMTSFINFMEAPTGRVIRVLVGAALMLWGFGFAGGTPVGLAVGIVGILPVATGVWGGCLPELFRR